MFNYVVTARKPSRVTHTAVGNFISPDQRNLLVAKVDHIEVYTIIPEGLAVACVLPIYGTISVMRLMRQPQEQQDWLVIQTEKYKLCVMKWNAKEGRCYVVSSSDTQDHLVSTHLSDRKGIVDPLGRCIALHQTQRLLKIIPTAPYAEKTNFNVRIVEDQIIDMVFLHGCSVPTIAILCTGSKDAQHFRTYEISMTEQDISEASWRKLDLDVTMLRMVPVPEPHAGVLVFGEDSIVYLAKDGTCVTQPIDTALITAVGAIGTDGTRFLISDHKGQLSMPILIPNDSGMVHRIKVESLGETSTAECISYLDNGFVFIGSNNGDSQLVRLSTKPSSETDSFVEVVKTFPHLGPVLDFCIVKGMGYLRQGQGQVVTCSGIGKDGSLRIIRNGIGISEYASEDLAGIKDMFSLRRNLSDRYHRYLLQSFTTETRVLELVSAEEMAPASLPGFDEHKRTLLAANMAGDILVQVTSSAVHVVDCSGADGMVARGEAAWTPPSDSHISVVAGNDHQLLIATTGRRLILLTVDVDKKTLVETSSAKLNNEVSCLNCNALQTAVDMSDSDKAGRTGEAVFAAVGLWVEVNESPVVELIALPSLKTIHSVKLGGDTISRCVLLATLESHHYLLIALGDGYLLTYCVNAEAAAVASTAADGGVDSKDVAKAVSEMGNQMIVSERRKLSVGTKPADLSIFKSKGSDHIFAACDRPTVVYSATGAGKLLVSNVNLQEVTRVCGFDTEAFPDCLAIATENGLHLGAVDEIQKLHITPVPLGEQPRRIAHLDVSRVFAVLTESTVFDESGDEMLEHFVRLIDDTRYDTMSKYPLNRTEAGSSLLATRFVGENIDKDEQFLVVGTCVELPNEEDPKDGRVLMFRVNNGKCVLVAQMSMGGAVYSLCSYKGVLVAGVGPEVRLLSVSEEKDGTVSIKEEDRHHGHILLYKIALRGDYILVGDLLRSVTLLTCKEEDGVYHLEEVAKDYNMTWVMALELLDDDTYIIAEHTKHLHTYRRKSGGASDSQRLERVGQFHLGMRVNRMEHGSLVMQMADDGPALSTLIFGTVDGMLGVIARLKPEVFKFFSEVERAMATLVPGVGGLKHLEWRDLVLEHPARSAPARNFLDGDLIERFLDLNAAQMSEVSSMVNVGVEELVQRVEEMQRLHGAG